MKWEPQLEVGHRQDRMKSAGRQQQQQQQQLETATPHATPSLAAENADLKADHNALNGKVGIFLMDIDFIILKLVRLKYFKTSVERVS